MIRIHTTRRIHTYTSDPCCIFLRTAMGICEVSVIGHGLGRTLGRPTRSTQNCRQSHDRMLACGWAKRRFFFGKKIIAFTRGEMVEIENLKGQKAHEHRKNTSWTISQNVWKSLNQPRWWVWQRLPWENPSSVWSTWTQFRWPLVSWVHFEHFTDFVTW